MQLISVVAIAVLIFCGLASATSIARTYLPPAREVQQLRRPQVVVQRPVVRPPAIYLPPVVSRPATQVRRVVSISRPVAAQRRVAVIPERVYLPPAPQRSVQAISIIPRLVAPQRTYLPPQAAAASSLSEQYEETNEL